jgi:hypothetical protein
MQNKMLYSLEPTMGIRLYEPSTNTIAARPGKPGRRRWRPFGFAQDNQVASLQMQLPLDLGRGRLRRAASGKRQHRSGDGWPARCQGFAPGTMYRAPTKPFSVDNRSGWRDVAKDLCQARRAVPLRNHPPRPIKADGGATPRNCAGRSGATPLRVRTAAISGGKLLGRRRRWPWGRRERRGRRMGCCAICWASRRRGRSIRDRSRKL